MRHRIVRLSVLLVVMLASLLAYAGPSQAKVRPGSNSFSLLNDLQFCTNGGRFQYATTGSAEDNLLLFVPPEPNGTIIFAAGLHPPFNPVDLEIDPEFLEEGQDPHQHRDYSATYTVSWAAPVDFDPGTVLGTNNAFGDITLADCFFTPIEIAPGRSNTVRPGKGRIEVAILNDPLRSFDPKDVKVSTVRFGAIGDEAKPVGKAKLRDADGDGKKDLILKFKVNKAKIVCSSTDAAVTGTTSAGESFVGSDAIRTRGCD